MDGDGRRLVDKDGWHSVYRERWHSVNKEWQHVDKKKGTAGLRGYGDSRQEQLSLLVRYQAPVYRVLLPGRIKIPSSYRWKC